jgi:hypothetical protein
MNNDHNDVLYGGAAGGGKTDAQERELERVSHDLAAVNGDHPDRVRSAIERGFMREAPRPKQTFEIPEQLRELMFVNVTGHLQFTDAGRVWLGKVNETARAILCIWRGSFAQPLLDQVDALKSARAILAGEAEGSLMVRPFDGLWTEARRGELLELMDLLAFEHPELAGLDTSWVASILAVSAMRGPEGEGNRAARRAQTTQERNRKKNARKAQRAARKEARRG